MNRMEPFPRPEREDFDGDVVSSVPPTAGEIGAASVRWERRGLLRRLRRLDDHPRSSGDA